MWGHDLSCIYTARWIDEILFLPFYSRQWRMGYIHFIKSKKTASEALDRFKHTRLSVAHTPGSKTKNRVFTLRRNFESSWTQIGIENGPDWPKDTFTVLYKPRTLLPFEFSPYRPWTVIDVRWKVSFIFCKNGKISAVPTQYSRVWTFCFIVFQELTLETKPWQANTVPSLMTSDDWNKKEFSVRVNEIRLLLNQDSKKSTKCAQLKILHNIMQQFSISVNRNPSTKFWIPKSNTNENKQK